MANEFIIRKGFKSKANSDLTGSLNISGSVYITGSLNTTERIVSQASITGSDVSIDDWGSISASLASISAQAVGIATLDQVTTQGNTTTNGITIGDLAVSGSISTTGDVFVSSSKSYYLGANSYLRRETNGGGYERIQLNGSIWLNPNTSANANNGVVIGGNGYLLSANSSRNAQLNYGGVSGQLGVYRLNVYGADSTFQHDVTVTGNVTSSDVSIDDWGSISASLANIQAGVSNADLQTVTNQGSTTTNSITVAGLTVNGSATATSFTGSLLGTATNAVEADKLDGQHGSYYLNASNINAGTISDAYLPGTISSDITGNAATATSATSATSSSYAVTASYVNQLNQDVTINGDLTVFGSSSFTYVTSSQLAVDDSYISVNVFEPAERFAGLKVYDSGSLSHQATASLSWDSTRNHWVYTNASGSTYSGGGLMSGPRNTGSLGDETYPTLNTIVRGQGGDHIYDSNITDDNTTVTVGIALGVTGSAEIKGNLSLPNISNATVDTDKFIVVDNGVVKYRTGAQLLSDIGGQQSIPDATAGTGSAGYITKWEGTSTLGVSGIYESGANIGIGTASPAANLEIYGTGNTLRLDSAANGAKELLFRNVGTQTATIKTDGDLKLYVEDSGKNILFDTVGGEQMRIQADGKVGMGTSTPAAKLNVVGGADVLIVEGSGSTANTTLFAVDGNNGRLFEISDDLSDSLFSVNTIAGLPVIEAFADNTVTLGAYNQYDVHITGSQVGIGKSNPAYKVDVNGTVAATALVETSARKFKTDIKPLESALETITQLEGVSFVRIGEETQEHGFIADDVHTVAPELVSYDENGAPYGVHYARTVALLTEGIKELNAKVNTQDLFIRDLLARIEKLENR